MLVLAKAVYPVHAAWPESEGNSFALKILPASCCSPWIKRRFRPIMKIPLPRGEGGYTPFTDHVSSPLSRNRPQTC
jgi:hypothetical protein